VALSRVIQTKKQSELNKISLKKVARIKESRKCQKKPQMIYLNELSNCSNSAEQKNGLSQIFVERAASQNGHRLFDVEWNHLIGQK
jgi:hypothetical protein